MNQNTQNSDNFVKESTASGSQIKGSPGGTEPPIVLGPDGKPCRACTDFKSWTKQMTGSVVGKTAPAMLDTPVKDTHKEPPKQKPLASGPDCPLDKGELGRNTWGFLHTMAAYYPETPTSKQQREMTDFIKIFSKFYPCEWCSYHLRERLKTDTPDTSSNKALSLWFCDYHNEVNRRLGKKEFDCSKVFERWRDGWADGSCD
ncbi:FAD-linked sulfhydryl oxidase ALR-like isoform X2 [Rhopilema esculentum]|uniref:FAD-linked sulfhydryl oxidase ALR-like isoform X2 n=1 Tax=Rhopilema esculentum TaxID=499914 RepID=UPI0031E49037